MKVHANILDTILNTPTHASNFGSPKLGDLFMDSDTRSNGKGRMATKSASVLSGDTELSEAFAGVNLQQAKVAAATKAARLTSVKAAIGFVEGLIKQVGSSEKLAGQRKQAFLQLVDAASRLRRLANKTAAQMQQDGASKLTDYFNPAVVPGWAKQATADFKLIADAYEKTQAPKIAKSAALLESSEDVLKERGLSDAEVQGYVRKWLNEGVSPASVQEKLNKLAELQLFDKSMASEYLNNHAGVLGLAYIEPNHYMNDCTSTAERLSTKLGGTKAASVKQIAACQGCKHFVKSAGQKRCNLYRLPVVSSQKELLPILNNLAGGAQNKKAALVARANGEHQKIAAQPKKASVYGRNTVKGRMLVNKGNLDEQQGKTAGVEFDAQAILAMHNAGQPMKAIYAHGTKVAGVVRTKKAMQAFLAGLKNSKTKIALSQIDCKFLAGKLGANNAIYGEKKCASCTYRSGMHCGLTGGTLIAFPGMDKAASKTAKIATTDGTGLISEFDLGRTGKQADIQFTASLPNDVELTNTRIDL